MPSRRALLAGLGAGALLYGGASVARLGRLEPLSVPTNTWPLARRDHHNTARSDGRIPVDPTVAWETGSVGGDPPTALVVGTDRVYAGGARLLALARADGAERWRADGGASRLALTTDRLYAAPPFDAESPGLRALDRDGTEAWRVPFPSADSIVPTESAVFASGHDRVQAVAPEGDPRFETDVAGAGQVYLAVHDGSLYAGGPMGVLRYERRTVLEAVDDHPPSVAWYGGKHGFAGPPTVHDGRLLVGYEDAGGAGAVKALDPSDGGTVWTALPLPNDTPVEQQWASSPVVVDGTAVVGVTRWLTEGREHALVGLDAADGRERWRRRAVSWLPDVAAGRRTVLFATSHDDAPDAPAGDAPPGSVWALAPDGTERWRVGFEAGVRAIAPVGDTVFALLVDGRVVALR
jgi:outer membrane protein assembly factor BamB